MYFHGPIASLHNINPYSPTPVPSANNMPANVELDHQDDTFSKNDRIQAHEPRFGWWPFSKPRRSSPHRPTRSRVEDPQRQHREARPLNTEQWTNHHSAATIQRVASYTERDTTRQYYRWKHNVHDTYNPQGVWMSRTSVNGRWRRI